MAQPPPDGSAAAVLAVDIGTTSAKSVAFDVTGQARSSFEVGYQLNEPEPGFAEQDPDVILAAVVETMRRAAADCPVPLAGISFSSAMHSLIGTDRDGVAVTPSITWADQRAGAQADRLRTTSIGRALHQRTGTPIHAMAPLAKLMWFRESAPDLFRRSERWIGIKEYVFAHLIGRPVMDHSIASGTGLFDLRRLDWDPQALELAGVTVDQLPELVQTTAVVGALTPQAARQTGIERSVPVVAGAGDGPLANLGLGAVQPGVAACSIGTSGALRVIVERPTVDPRGGVFCYALTPGRWAVGGAINNGGIVLEWAGRALAPDSPDPDALLEFAGQAPPGSGGLVMLPYLLSERAPHWSSVPRGAYIGVTHEHGRPHLIRAALEGVCQQLALVLESVREAGNDVNEIRATGGFARSPLWRQMLADALDMPIGFPAGPQGSAFGAALLGMEALGLVESIGLAADLVTITETVHPDTDAAATYAAIRPIFRDLYDALGPSFSALRRLAPALPDTP